VDLLKNCGKGNDISIVSSGGGVGIKEFEVGWLSNIYDLIIKCQRLNFWTYLG